MVGVRIVVDPRFVTSGSVTQNSSEARRRLTLLNEVTMPIGIEAVGVLLYVVLGTHVMCQLMTKAVIAKCTTLLTNGEGVP